MYYEHDMEESVIGDYIFGKGRFQDPREAQKQKIIDDVTDIKHLASFNQDQMPPDAYELWKKISHQFSRFAKPGDTPKVIYNRFLAKKRDEYAKKRKLFQANYGHDWTELDVTASRNSIEPVWRSASM